MKPSIKIIWPIIFIVCLAFWFWPYIAFGITGKAILWSFASFGALFLISFIISLIIIADQVVKKYKAIKSQK